jgi:hypothetical protein
VLAAASINADAARIRETFMHPPTNGQEIGRWIRGLRQLIHWQELITTVAQPERVKSTHAFQ